MTKIGFVLIICACLAPAAPSRVIELQPNEVRLLPMSANERVMVQSNVRRNNVSHMVLHANAVRPVCVGMFPSARCPAATAFEGTDVGWEQLVAGRSNMSWNLYSATKQDVFIALRAYKKAPVVGECSEYPVINPNLRLNFSHDSYVGVSFNFSSIFESDRDQKILTCSNDVLKTAITYELYAMPWNQRYRQPHPSFNASSLRGLKTVLNISSSAEVFNKGILLTSFKMSSPYSPPNLHVSKRIGLDVVLTVAARLDTDDSEAAFYVSHLVWGCTSDPKTCVLLDSLILKIVVGVFACLGLLFSHLGRRFHRLNTFFSGYFMGFLVSYILLGRFTKLGWEANLGISLSASALVLAALNCGLFWRSKPNWRSSYMALYVDASFLIIASLFFTSIGNQPLWKQETAFIGTFYGLVAFLSFLIFPWVTELISVDLCTALVGSFLFVAGFSAIFLPGVVFPYILWDAVSRVTEADNHAALSIFVNSPVDFAVFGAWPLMALLIAVFNRCCSKPLTPPPEPTPVMTPPTESWPPLPPDAFVSERAPLLNDRRDSQHFATAPPAANPVAPPPYAFGEDPPPAYRP